MYSVVSYLKNTPHTNYVKGEHEWVQLFLFSIGR